MSGISKSGVSRRELLVSGLGFSAASLLAQSAWGRSAAMMSASAEALTAVAPREHLLFRFWLEVHVWAWGRSGEGPWVRDGPGRLCKDRGFQLRQGEV